MEVKLRANASLQDVLAMVAERGRPETACVALGDDPFTGESPLESAARECLVQALQELLDDIACGRQEKFHFRILGPTEGDLEIAVWPKGVG